MMRFKCLFTLVVAITFCAVAESNYDGFEEAVYVENSRCKSHAPLQPTYASRTGEDYENEDYEDEDYENDGYEDDGYDPEAERFHFDINYNDGLLNIHWFNVQTYCGVSKMHTLLRRQEDNRLEFFVDAECEVPVDCLCLYDVKSSFEKIEPGHYTVALWNNGYYTYELDIFEGCEYSLPPKDTSVENVEYADDKIYVDSSRKLHTSSEGEYTVSIYSANGLLRASVIASGESEISLSSLQPGIYLVRLSDGQKAVIRI